MIKDVEQLESLGFKDVMRALIEKDRNEREFRDKIFDDNNKFSFEDCTKEQLLDAIKILKEEYETLDKINKEQERTIQKMLVQLPILKPTNNNKKSVGLFQTIKRYF